MRKRIASFGALGLGIALLFVTMAHAITCPPDAVPVGTLCVDKYEASVWSVPDPTTRNKQLVTKLKKGTATPGDLVAGGAAQLGCDDATFNHEPFPPNFPPNGNWSSILIPPTPGVYAASVPGVLPSACGSWFQYAQSCRLSDKRLLTNAEWQDAAAGTPDPGNDDDGSTTCVTNSAGPDDTGSRTSCKSNWGAFDMVGNVREWVADWVPESDRCTAWEAFNFSDDEMCFAGVFAFAQGPSALLRGGTWFGGSRPGFGGSQAGVFSINADVHPSRSGGDTNSIGFRCAR